jgi:hypothetical protein
MIQIAEVVEESMARDKMGRVIQGENVYTPIKKIRINGVFPFGSANTQKAYGYEVNTTHRTFTIEDIKTPSFLRINNVIYFVAEVARYPRINVVLLEKV